VRAPPVTALLDRTIRTAIGACVIARLATLLAIVIASQIHHGDLDSLLGKSDGVWYLGIAQHGYGPTPPIGPDGVYTHLSSLAFFPMYPLLIRAFALPDVSYLAAALFVTAIAGLIAAGFIAAWARPIVGDRGAITLVAVWSLLPSSAVFDMAYSEALFVAAAAGCLLALQRRRWIAAAVAAIVGGLTRPTGGALVLAVAIAAGLEVWRHRRLDPRVAAAVVLAPLGLGVALLHVSLVTGRWDGWFWLESTVWRSGFDGGRSAAAALRSFVTGGPALHHLPLAMSACVCVAFVALTYWALRAPGRPQPPDAAYPVAAGVLAIGERRYFYVKPRLLLVGYPVLVPVARRLAALSTRTLIGLAIPSLVLTSIYNAYLVVYWPKAL
jgi:hypothetical protein